MLMKLVRLQFAVLAFGATVIVAAGVLYHFGLGHSGRLGALPDGKSILAGGVVVESKPAGDEGSGGVATVEDLTGFIDVAWTRESPPRAGSLVLISGTKWELDGQPVVLAERTVLSRRGGQ